MEKAEKSISDELAKDLFTLLQQSGFNDPDLQKEIKNAVINWKGFSIDIAYTLKFAKDTMRGIVIASWNMDKKTYEISHYTGTVKIDGKGCGGYFKFPGTRPHLAYYRLSGKFQRLVDELSGIGLLGEGYIRSTKYFDLERALNTQPAGFDYYFAAKGETGNIQYKVPINTTGNVLAINPIEATLHVYPVIQHGIFNGVDSRKLEHEMKEMDWIYPVNYRFGSPQAIELGDKKQRILEKLDQMDSDVKGRLVSTRLKEKYWIAEHSDPSPEISSTVFRKRFPVNMHARDIHNEMREIVSSQNRKRLNKNTIRQASKKNGRKL